MNHTCKQHLYLSVISGDQVSILHFIDTSHVGIYEQPMNDMAMAVAKLMTHIDSADAEAGASKDEGSMGDMAAGQQSAVIL